MKPIFLIGYMASGKTTLGRAVAKQLHIAFYDLDAYIESRFHTTIARIFNENGEETFRQRESAMLRELGEMENVIVACGGGTPCTEGNMEYMNRAGLTVFLETEIDCIFRRLKRNRSRRPLVANMKDSELRNFIEHNLAERMPYYSMSSTKFRSNNLENPSQISKSVDEFIAKFVAISSSTQ